jgi:hypothetical protein
MKIYSCRYGETVAALVLGTSVERRGGSSPSTDTSKFSWACGLYEMEELSGLDPHPLRVRLPPSLPI